MGGTYDGLYSVYHSGNYCYYCIDGSSNPGGWATRNVIWHFLLLDYNGNPQPLKKRYNQKLFIYVYHTLILPEKMIIDSLEFLVKTYDIDGITYYVIYETDFNGMHFFVLSNKMDYKDIIIKKDYDGYLSDVSNDEYNEIMKQLLKFQ